MKYILVVLHAVLLVSFVATAVQAYSDRRKNIHLAIITALIVCNCIAIVFFYGVRP